LISAYGGIRDGLIQGERLDLFACQQAARLRLRENSSGARQKHTRCGGESEQNSKRRRFPHAPILPEFAHSG
jgi:hypothetical protein